MSKTIGERTPAELFGTILGTNDSIDALERMSVRALNGRAGGI